MTTINTFSSTSEFDLKSLKWEFHCFESLTTTQLFQLMKLRTDVFVVEQHCAYPELDHHDNHPQTIHLLCSDEHGVVAYARAMPSDPSMGQGSDAPSEVRIGRVVVALSHRGSGIAQELMSRLLSHLEKRFPNDDLVLAAQQPITDFYQTFSFQVESEPYLEDGIPHVDMRRREL